MERFEQIWCGTTADPFVDLGVPTGKFLITAVGSGLFLGQVPHRPISWIALATLATLGNLPTTDSDGRPTFRRTWARASWFEQVGYVSLLGGLQAAALGHTLKSLPWPLWILVTYPALDLVWNKGSMALRMTGWEPKTEQTPDPYAGVPTLSQLRDRSSRWAAHADQTPQQ